MKELHDKANIDYDHVDIQHNPSVASLYEDALVYESGSAITSAGAWQRPPVARPVVRHKVLLPLFCHPLTGQTNELLTSLHHRLMMSGGVPSTSLCQLLSGKSIVSERSITSTLVPEFTSLTAMLDGTLVTESRSVLSAHEPTTVSS